MCSTQCRSHNTHCSEKFGLTKRTPRPELAIVAQYGRWPVGADGRARRLGAGGGVAPERGGSDGAADRVRRADGRPRVDGSASVRGVSRVAGGMNGTHAVGGGGGPLARRGRPLMERQASPVRRRPASTGCGTGPERTDRPPEMPASTRKRRFSLREDGVLVS